MLYDLYGEEAGIIYRCWNTAVKLVWNVPRNTSTFLVENVLAKELSSVRRNLLTRYTVFCKNILNKSSMEVRLLARIAVADIRSNTGKNICKISKEIGNDALQVSKYQVGEALVRSDVPVEDTWKIPLLTRLLKDRQQLRVDCLDTEPVDELIEVVCTSNFS